MAMIEDFANKVSAKGGSVTLVEFGWHLDGLGVIL
jgi:hypothetical protein